MPPLEGLYGSLACFAVSFGMLVGVVAGWLR